MPFSALDFFEVFRRYNTGVWPTQIGLLALALALLVVVVRGQPGGARLVYGGLAVLWAWCGAVYHIVFFTRINPAAFAFGGLFLVQAGLFAWAAARADGESFAVALDGRGLLGSALIAYALLLYPLLGWAFGQHYPAAPSFGLPCPLTIFTFGVLPLAVGRVPVHLLVMPFAWALLAVSAAWSFGVMEDLALPVAALCGAAAVLLHNRRSGAALPADVGETPAPAEGIRRLH